MVKVAEPLSKTYATPPFCEQRKTREKEEGEIEKESNTQRKEKVGGRECQGVCAGSVCQKTLQGIYLIFIYINITLTVAVFPVRVQVVKMAEEPLPLTYTTPPVCE